MKQVTVNIPEGYRLKPEEEILEKIPAIYTIGMLFSQNGDVLMLCQIDPNRITMILQRTGNRWCEPIRIDCGAYSVPEKEIDRLMGGQDWQFHSSNGHDLVLL